MGVYSRGGVGLPFVAVLGLGLSLMDAVAAGFGVVGVLYGDGRTRPWMTPATAMCWIWMLAAMWFVTVPALGETHPSIWVDLVTLPPLIVGALGVEIWMQSDR